VRRDSAVVRCPNQARKIGLFASLSGAGNE
jgi:hypothetical protein